MKSIEIDKERLMAEVAFKDSSSMVIKIRRKLPDFLHSVKLKYAKLGYSYSCNPSTLLLFLIVCPLFLATAAQLTSPAFSLFSDMTRTLLLDTATILVVSTLLMFLLGLYWAKRPRPIYLIDFACYKPEDERKLSIDFIMKTSVECGHFEPESVNFHNKISYRSGLGDETYFAKCITSNPPNLSMKEARQEAEEVMFGALDSIFAETGVHPKEIGILIVNCSLYDPTPSLSAMIVNHYKLRTDIKSLNLGGMGCSAGLISINLAKHLLQANPNSYAVVVSTENITLNWNFSNDRSMLLCNCIFRLRCSSSFTRQERRTGAALGRWICRREGMMRICV